MDELRMPGEPSQEMLDVLKRELEPGEHLVWNAAPDRNAFARGLKGVRVFGLIFGGFALFWMGGAFAMTMASHKTGGSFSFFPLFGLPFLAIGCALTFGTAWAARKRAARSIYGLTARRAIVIEGSWQQGERKVYSYKPEQLELMSKVERPDGSGDLVFEEVDAGYTQNKRKVFRPRGFLGVMDVQGVERVVRKTLQISSIGVMHE